MNYVYSLLLGVAIGYFLGYQRSRQRINSVLEHAVAFQITCNKLGQKIQNAQKAVSYAKVRLLPYEAEVMENMMEGKSVE